MIKSLCCWLAVILFYISLGIGCVNAQSQADSLLKIALLKHRIVTYPADSVVYFSNGKDKFADLVTQMKAAKHHIHVEYFIFSNDSIAQTLLDIMKQKAAEGVEVRLVIDDYKSSTRHYGYDNKRCKELRSQGIDIRMYDPWKFPYLNHVCRDHRKIVVIDGKVGYIGGLNVADYYINGNANTYGDWRDAHVRIEGYAVEGLQRLFYEAYRVSGGKKYDGPAYYPYSADSKASAFELMDGKLQVAFVERSKKKNAEMRNMIAAALHSAQKKLKIVSPYFLPTTKVRRALIDAIDRGVEVEVLLSKESDEPLLNIGNMSFAQRLMKHGAKVYIYEGAFHHSKIMMVDDSYAFVGSANLNSRSLRWDAEASCFVFDKELTADMTTVFEEDKLHCDTFSLEKYKQIPAKKRLSGWFVNHLLTPIL